MPMDSIEIWCQVHHLPFGFMSEPMGRLVGNHIGKYVKYDDLNNCGSWRKYMRIPVAININEPLKKSLVSWNCRGLGCPSTVPNLKYLA
ncbi:cysteine desulfurase mitochondrial-like [Trifolium pratense]|uniref:Cysteine desulfurase mitochondrial-like n=1 Tax=Trifolium pratense TaxID=57577 RepID=A0A2K3LTF9_TRIPR|nr:cysteine desulfurase mitochondrial-like [Trifolium pratense]